MGTFVPQRKDSHSFPLCHYRESLTQATGTSISDTARVWWAERGPPLKWRTGLEGDCGVHETHLAVRPQGGGVCLAKSG